MELRVLKPVERTPRLTPKSPYYFCNTSLRTGYVCINDVKLPEKLKRRITTLAKSGW